MHWAGNIYKLQVSLPITSLWKKQIYEVKLYGCYILELLAHSQMRMLAEIARFPERNFWVLYCACFYGNFPHTHKSEDIFFADNEMNEKREI